MKKYIIIKMSKRTEKLEHRFYSLLKQSDNAYNRFLPMLTAPGKVWLSVSTVNPLLRFVTL